MRAQSVLLGMVMAGCGGAPASTSPSSASLECSAALDCQAFSCGCQDGTRWDSARYCFNQRCQDQRATCENACIGRGGVAVVAAGGGSAGGGTASGATCSVASSCQAYSCACPDGTQWDTARYCLNSVCQGQAATCTNACRDHQRSVTPTVIGCELRRWSNDYSVSAVMYGSGSTESAAFSQASRQCTNAAWTASFCGGASDYCANESAVPYRCEFSRYSSTQARTIRFTGFGTGISAAKADAVNRCIASGDWKGWFCTSGSLSCSAT